MTKGSKILVVEDDSGIREALKLTLEFGGYAVDTAENGREGLERLSASKAPCLILLDLMMPIMDGWEFADALKNEKALASIPIVVVTAFADQAQSIGASRVIKKPVDVNALLKLVTEYCG